MRRFPIRSRTTAEGHAIPSRRRRPAVEGLEERLCLSGYLVVSSYENNMLLRYDESTGAFVDQIDPKNLANMNTPTCLVFGPDHNLYVSDRLFKTSQQAVLQYNGTSGAFQAVFASQDLGSPRGVVFGPDGDLYVVDGGPGSDGTDASVERFDGQTGAFLSDFVAPGSGGIAHPGFEVFGPDGNLYVGDVHSGRILRYDGTTGAPLPGAGNTGADFVAAAAGGLDAPQGMVFGPDGNLYVASGNFFTAPDGPAYKGDDPPGAVLKFEGPTGPTPGAFLGTFIAGGSGGLANPLGLLFGPDGDLYVSSCVKSGDVYKAEAHTSVVLRYDGTTGAFLSTLVAPDSGGLRCPLSMCFTETDPTTLNFDGATTGAAAIAALTQLPPGLPATSTTGRTTGSGNRFGLTLAPGPVCTTPPPGDTKPAPPSASVSRLVPSLIGDLPPDGQAVDSSPPPRKSRSAGDRILASLNAGSLLDLTADGPALAARN